MAVHLWVPFLTTNSSSVRGVLSNVGLDPVVPWNYEIKKKICKTKHWYPCMNLKTCCWLEVKHKKNIYFYKRNQSCGSGRGSGLSAVSRSESRPWIVMSGTGKSFQLKKQNKFGSKEIFLFFHLHRGSQSSRKSLQRVNLRLFQTQNVNFFSFLVW